MLNLQLLTGCSVSGGQRQSAQQEEERLKRYYKPDFNLRMSLIWWLSFPCFLLTWPSSLAGLPTTSLVSGISNTFQNPRSHTGKGYHQHTSSRQNVSQQWKIKSTNTLEWDSAQRWRFVASATGLATSDDELDAIADICNSWDNLYWNRNDPPDLQETKYACGSHGGLIRMLFQVARQNDVGAAKSCHREELDEFKNGHIEKQDIDTECPYDHGCPNQEAFMREHQDDVARLKRKLTNLPCRAIKVELLRWFLGRDAAGQVLIDWHYRKVLTEFSDRVDSAHREYGELMYPRKSNLCRCHGVLFNDDD
jgi:hypothetical protein